MGVLRDTKRFLVQYQGDPDCDRLVQACGVLTQVVQERQNYLERYQRNVAAPAPVVGSVLQHSGVQGVDEMTGAGANTNSFFTERVKTEWQDRCSYYQPIIEALLTNADGTKGVD